MTAVGRGEALVVDAVRTPIGRRNGSLSEVHPVELSVSVLTGLLGRADVDPAAVEDVVWGCVNQVGEQASNVARLAVLAAGWPTTVPGTTVDRACGSSQQAVHFAAAGVASGQYDLVVAGGVEAMSRVPLGSARRAGPGLPYGPLLRSRYPTELAGAGEFSQGRSAEIIAERWGLSRTQLDEYSLGSHARAAAAQEQGVFAREIVPVAVAPAHGTARVVDTDEGIRRESSLETLAGLRTAFCSDGVVTAGNSSQISDGASAVLLASRRGADRLGVPPVARLVAYSVVGVDPIEMLTGPIPATAAVLRRAGLELRDIDAFEVNEAFASVVCAWLADTGADPGGVNAHGGAIALGHPLGGSGARLLTSLLSQLRERGGRYGLLTMCEGGGMANALVVESLD